MAQQRDRVYELPISLREGDRTHDEQRRPHQRQDDAPERLEFSAELLKPEISIQ